MDRHSDPVTVIYYEGKLSAVTAFIHTLIGCLITDFYLWENKDWRILGNSPEMCFQDNIEKWYYITLPLYGQF